MAQNNAPSPAGKVPEIQRFPREALVKEWTILRELNRSVFSSKDPHHFEVCGIGPLVAFVAGLGRAQGRGGKERAKAAFQLRESALADVS